MRLMAYNVVLSPLNIPMKRFAQFFAPLAIAAACVHAAPVEPQNHPAVSNQQKMLPKTSDADALALAKGIPSVALSIDHANGVKPLARIPDFFAPAKTPAPNVDIAAQFQARLLETEIPEKILRKGAPAAAMIDFSSAAVAGYYADKTNFEKIRTIRTSIDLCKPNASKCAPSGLNAYIKVVESESGSLRVDPSSLAIREPK